MKILYIITGLRFGGAEKLLYLTCKQLSGKYGAEIHVVYFDPYAPMRFLFAGINVTTALFRRNLALLPRLLLHIRREKYDVVHTHLIHADIYGRLAALLAGPTAIPVIFTTVHDLDWFRWQKGLYFSLVRKIDYWLSSPRRNHVIAISRSVRNLLIEKQNYSANKIVLLYNAIEVTTDSASKPSHPKVIRCLYLGRLVKKKNIPCLIRAMALLRAPNLQLTIVGEGEEEASLKQLVKDLNLSSFVRFHPATLEVASYYQQSDIFILPSTYEGLGIVILEAFSHRLPVIGSNVHGISELLADNRGLLFENDDSVGLAERIKTLLEDPGKRSDYGNRGYEYVRRHHDIQHYVDKLVHLYAEAKAGRASLTGDHAQ